MILLYHSRAHNTITGLLIITEGHRLICAAGKPSGLLRKRFADEDVLFCLIKENQKGRRCPQGMKAPVGFLSRRPVCEANAACSARQGRSDFDALQPGGDYSLLAPKENQKGRRCPEGMKAPVGLLSRRPVCEANAACLARQGRSDFDMLQPGGVCSLLTHKREPEKRQRFRRAGPTN